MIDDPLFLVTVNLLVAFLIRCVMPNLASGVLMAVVLVASSGYLGGRHGSDMVLAAYSARDALLTFTGSAPAWPPEKYREYPDLKLVDQEGRWTQLSEFRGKVILIQPVGMPSRASVAFSGGHELGPFHDVRPQANLENVSVYAKQFGKTALKHPDLVCIQLVLFNEDMMAPKPSELRAWADHFRLSRKRNQVVLAATPEMATFESHGMVPGFQLIDKDFVLRSDATGAKPLDSLYTDLLPMIPKLLNE